MITAKKEIAHHQHFHSVSEYVTYVESKPRRANNAARHAEQLSRREGKSWYGVEGVPEVRAAVAEGWQEGAENIEAIYAKMSRALPKAIDIRRKRTRGDRGDSLDIHAVLRGDLSRAWETTGRAMRHGTSLVRIITDICGNADVGAEQLKWRGVAALALSSILNQAGYSTEICVAIAGRNGANGDHGAITMQTVTVKPRHVIQDTRLLAATVCLPGFFRLYGFLGIVHQADKRGKDVSGSFGQAYRADACIEPDARVLQTVTPALGNAAAVEAWLIETLKLFQKSTMQAEGGR